MCETCKSEAPNLMAMWAEADKKAKDWREAGEEKLLQQMLDAYEGLKSLGWREGRYAPKDGTRFLSIQTGSTGVFPCYWMNNEHMKEGGSFWCEAHGDLWPAKPMLWKPMPANKETNRDHNMESTGMYEPFDKACDQCGSFGTKIEEQPND